MKSRISLSGVQEKNFYPWVRLKISLSGVQEWTFSISVKGMTFISLKGMALLNISKRNGPSVYL